MASKVTLRKLFVGNRWVDWKSLCDLNCSPIFLLWFQGFVVVKMFAMYQCFLL